MKGLAGIGAVRPPSSGVYLPVSITYSRQRQLDSAHEQLDLLSERRYLSPCRLQDRGHREHPGIVPLRIGEVINAVINCFGVATDGAKNTWQSGVANT